MTKERLGDFRDTLDILVKRKKKDPQKVSSLAQSPVKVPLETLK
jgi:hypothetical protein